MTINIISIALLIISMIFVGFAIGIFYSVWAMEQCDKKNKSSV